MRILSFICVIVVMVLNMVPCADMHEELNSKAKAFITAHDVSHNTPAADACTPFCHCSCCAASAVIKVTSNLTVPIAAVYHSSTPYLNKHYFTASLSIWQPPKFI